MGWTSTRSPIFPPARDWGLPARSRSACCTRCTPTRASSPPKNFSARKACEIEIDILKDPIGKQDIYAAAYGGLNAITFYPDETVQVEPIVMPAGQRDQHSTTTS